MTTVPPPPPMLVTRFGPLDVEYDARVLVPRDWTLLQSTWAADLARTAAPGPILELFAGAGHIGLAAAVLADRYLVQVEVDPVAAEYARRNAAGAGRAEQVEIRAVPVADALGPDETFPLIVADPPYLRSGELSRWPDDPVRAIDGGLDGLDLIRSCIGIAEQHLALSGQLLLQVAGAGQAAQLRAVLDRSGRSALRIVEQRVVDDRRAVVLLARP